MTKRKLGKINTLVIYSLCIAGLFIVLSACINIFARGPVTPPFYASDFVNDPNGGYLNATFEYGSYPQSKVTDTTLKATLNGLSPDANDVVTNGDDRYKKVNSNYYKFEPIKWRILSIDEGNNEVFVLSEYILDSQKWDDQTSTMYTWDGKDYKDESNTTAYVPTIRTWLNEEFYNTAFTADEKLNIIPKEYEAYNDDIREYIDGDKTEDKITLLSSLETAVIHDGQDMAVKYGFDSNCYGENQDWFSKVYTEETNRLGVMTDYALVNYSSDTPYTIEIDNSINYMKKTGAWWTRSRISVYCADRVDRDGCATISEYANYSYGVRLALSLNLLSLKGNEVKINYGLRGSYDFKGYSFDNEPITTTKPTGLTLENIKKLKVYFSNEKTVDTNKTLTTWYANAIDDNKNHGYINLGTYPKTKVGDEYIISKLDDLYVSDMTPITYGYNKYVKKDDSYYQLEPITWQVLKFNDDGTALLLTKDVIDSKQFDTQNANDYKWDDASNPPPLRTWLNGDFYDDAFTEDEKILIDEHDYEIYDEKDGSNATVRDKVTLLSDYETYGIEGREYGFANDYNRIGMSSGRIGYGTDFALSSYRVEGMILPIAGSRTDSGNSMYWWTRSRYAAIFAAYVSYDGSASGNAYVCENFGVRPALSLNLSSLEGLNGDGSLESPYTFEEVKYTVNFDSNGGIGVMNAVTNLNSGDTYTIPECLFTKEGYTFDYWTINGVKIAESTITISSDVTLKANWKQNSSGGGSSGGSSNKKDTSQTITVQVASSTTNNNVYKAYMKGYNDKTFKPDENITRAEIATIFSRELNYNIDNEDYAKYSNKYNDLSLSWYDNYIGYLTNKNIFEGYGDNSFKPQNGMTKAEFAKSIVKMFNVKMNKTNVVDNKNLANKWYKDYLDIMYSNYYIDDSYIANSNIPITREEVCKIVNAVSGRKVKTKDTLSSEDEKFIKENFKDLNENDKYYYDIVSAVIDLTK